MFLPCFLLVRCSQWLLDYDLNAPSAGGESIVSIIRSNAMRSVLIGSEYPVTGTPRFLSPIHRREEMRLLYVGFFVVRQIFINYRVIMRSCAWLIARQTEHGISFCCDFLAANVRIPAHPIHQWKKALRCNHHPRRQSL